MVETVRYGLPTDPVSGRARVLDVIGATGDPTTFGPATGVDTAYILIFTPGGSFDVYAVPAEVITDEQFQTLERANGTVMSPFLVSEALEHVPTEDLAPAVRLATWLGDDEILFAVETVGEIEPQWARGLPAREELEASAGMWTGYLAYSYRSDPLGGARGGKEIRGDLLTGTPTAFTEISWAADEDP